MGGPQTDAGLTAALQSQTSIIALSDTSKGSAERRNKKNNGNNQLLRRRGINYSLPGGNTDFLVILRQDVHLLSCACKATQAGLLKKAAVKKETRRRSVVLFFLKEEMTEAERRRLKGSAGGC